MMRSLYSGVSGLQNHQIRMDVIGNNISNVNTIGFKRGRVNFHDMLSQGLQGAARPTDELGGVNPKQVGLGMTVASVDTIHTQGAMQTTGVGTDVAIQGEGFFILSSGNKDFYTRAGAFGVDSDGTLVNPATGMRVQGWMAENEGGEAFLNTASDPGDLVIPVGSKDPASATTEVDLACNLDKRMPVVPEGAEGSAVMNGTWSLNKTIYDDFGREHLLSMDFTKIPDMPNRWQVTVAVDAGSETPSETWADIAGNGNETDTFIMEFDNYGLLSAAIDEQGDAISEGELKIGVSYLVPETAEEEGAPVRRSFDINLGEVGSAVNTVTQFAEKSSTKAFRQNGYTMGYLENFKIDQSGIITGVYSNGTNRTIGQLAMASFTNQAALEKAGESTYTVTNNSGEPNVGPSGIAGKGKFLAGALEMSNVDLAEQFTDMIVTQRGFQANSKTIQTSDQMLQELLTLKR